MHEGEGEDEDVLHLRVIEFGGKVDKMDKQGRARGGQGQGQGHTQTGAMVIINDNASMVSSSSHFVTIDYLEGTSFLLCCSYRHMFPLGLCQYLEDQYVFSLGPQHFSLAPFPQDAPTPVPLLIFPS